MNPMKCPRCSRGIEGFTECKSDLSTGPVGEGAPQSGNLIVCIYCDAELMMAENGWREITADERANFDRAMQDLLAVTVASTRAFRDRGGLNG